MRGIIARCLRLDVRDLGDETLKSYAESHLVLICIEKGDGGKAVRGAASRINKVVKMRGGKDALLLPYSHLSSNLEEAKTARELCARLAEKLASKGCPADLLSFGTKKELDVCITEKAFGNTYFEF